MTAPTAWFFWLTIGMTVGYLLGLVTNVAEVEARLAREGRKVPAARDRLAKVRAARLLPLIVLLIVCTSTFYAYRVQQQQNQQNRHAAQQNKCSVRILTEFLAAVNDRAAEGAASMAAQDNLLGLQARLLTVSTDPNATQQQKAAVFLDYLNALTNYNKARSKVKVAVVAHPYPTAADVTNCYR